MAVQAQYNSSNVVLQDMISRMRQMGGTPGLPVLFGPANVLEDFQMQRFAPFSAAAPHVHPPEIDMACGLLCHPKKRLRGSEQQDSQQQQQISMNNFPNSAGVSTGLRLAYYDDEDPNSSVTSASGNAGNFGVLSAILNEDITAEMERQRTELERYLTAQAEQFWQALKEMKQRHFASFLEAMEAGLGQKLQEKDMEVENLNRRNRELGDRIKQMAMEAQSWHSRAKYSEAMVCALRNNLQQAQSKEHSREGCGDSQVDDAASSHYGDNNAINIPKNNNNNNNHNHNMGEIHVRTLRENIQMKEQRRCRICRSRDVSILLLPCRHLCLCKDCENVLDVCPLCRCLKSASVQVYMA